VEQQLVERKGRESALLELCGHGLGCCQPVIQK